MLLPSVDIASIHSLLHNESLSTLSSNQLSEIGDSLRRKRKGTKPVATALTGELILAIDQGTTNSKAALISADGRVVAGGSAPVGTSSPRPEWVEQDAERLWSSVLEAVTGCIADMPDAQIAGVALSTQRESVVGWQASTGTPLGPVIGWQDRRTTDWCNQTIDDQDRMLVHARSGLRVDPMFSAPKMRWLLDHLPTAVQIDDVRLGTIDSWLIWRLTAGAGLPLRSRERLSYLAL